MMNFNQLAPERVENHTGCYLHKAAYSLEVDFVSAVECRKNCNIDRFWKSKKSLVKKLRDFDYENSPFEDAKTWYTEKKGGNIKSLKKLADEPEWGKGYRSCMRLGDAIILLHAKVKDHIVVSLDHSFVAMSQTTKHRVHKMNNVAAMLGGTVQTISKQEFLARSGVSEYPQ